MKESTAIKIAVIALAAMGLVSLIAIGLLAFEGKDVPDALAAAAGGTVGALATLLTTYSPNTGPMPGGRRATDPPP